MKKPLPALESESAATPPARPSGARAAQAAARRQIEELKVQVIELLQRDMDAGMRVLRAWIASDGRK